jgi:hypothetical protein
MRIEKCVLAASGGSGAIAGFAVLPLATNGSGTLGVLMTLTPPATSGQTDLILDVTAEAPEVGAKYRQATSPAGTARPTCSMPLTTDDPVLRQRMRLGRRLDLHV